MSKELLKKGEVLDQKSCWTVKKATKEKEVLENDKSATNEADAGQTDSSRQIKQQKKKSL